MLLKIKGVIRRIANNFKNDCRFSFYFALLGFLRECFRILRLNKLSTKANKSRDKWILNYLTKLEKPVIEKYKNNTEVGKPDENAPIWICWWTGFESAPELVKRCIKSTYKNAGNHPVNFITQENYSDYLEIPRYILDKATSGNMAFAHLADYIRVKLLGTYGGLWLDATIFCNKNIPSEYFNMPLFTLKGPVEECGYVSKKRWVTFCLGGWQGNVIYRYLVDAFEQYWKYNEYAVDYLFFDHLILLGYENIPFIRKLIDEIPDNNIHRDDLQAAMNAALPEIKWNDIVKNDTILYKLSWREKYTEKTTTGENTVYSKLLNNNIEQ